MLNRVHLLSSVTKMFLVLSAINRFYFKRLVIKMFSFPQCTISHQFFCIIFVCKLNFKVVY